jgi:acyl phosphate:glycerol-3-phosphate acyltransferase
MGFLPLFLIPVIGYLLGSIPFGYLLVKSAQGADIRTIGSGNIGATNVYRKSRSAGLLTLLADGGKGYLAVLIAGWMGGGVEWQSVAAFSAILGHLFTVWLKFKGGKGVATGCGAFLALSPLAVGLTLVVFVATLMLTRYISLSSILATAAFPLWVFLFHQPLQVLAWALIGSALIIARHHQNIRRLLSGTESKFALGSH